ncbi:MAG: aspartate carbamoyltransferase [Ruminococcus sp.]|jgi:aspartate carbamoyltransferase catalytic subunit|nr:aspartate carbamoyltransferase [Ruminococcus sp.]
MAMKISHFIDLNDYSVEWLTKVLKLGHHIFTHPHRFAKAYEGKIMASAFFEPSTRTKLSFHSAMQRLGGSVLGFDNPNVSSIIKGESLKDTIKMLESYSDLIVLRHPIEGAAFEAAKHSNIPVINAGDGKNLHPTQTLTDLLTIREERGSLENMTIGVAGDLKFGRTTHSLVKALSKYQGNKFIFISDPELTMPDDIKIMCDYKEVSQIKDAVSGLDILYMTRFQAERTDKEICLEVLDKAKLKNAKENLLILHPLPRVNEIAEEIDSDPRALYFKQAMYGVYIRMALIITLFEN